MESGGVLHAVPIWVFFVGTLFLVLLSVEGGYFWARCRLRREKQEKEAPVGAMVGAALGLLAFLLAFVFGLAMEHFQARKLALVDEANAIRKAYLLTDVVPDAHQAGLRQVLRAYVDERLRWVRLQGAEGEPSGRALLDQLWAQAAKVGAQNPGGVDVFLEAVHRVIELHAERVMVRERTRIPGFLWVILVTISVLATASMGYHCGVAGTVRSPVMLAVAIAFSAVIMLIADLDLPGEGFINVSQQPMVDVRDALRSGNR